MSSHEFLSVPFLHACAISLHTVSGLGGLFLIGNNDPRIAVFGHYVNLVGSGDVFEQTPLRLFKVRPILGLIAVEFVTAVFHVIYFWKWRTPPHDERPLVATVEAQSPPTPALPAGGVAVPTQASFFRNLLVPPGAQSQASAPSPPPAPAEPPLTDAPLQPSANALRWFEYAVTATLMNLFGAVSLGIQDVYVLFKLAFEGVALQMCGWVLEKLDARVPKEAFVGSIIMIIGFILNLSTTALYIWTISASTLHTWSFVLNVLPFAFYFSTFGYVSSQSFFRRGPFYDNVFTEKAYLLLSLTTKLAIFWISLTTYLSVLQDKGLMPRSNLVGTTLDLSAVRVVATVLPPSLLLFLLTLEAWYYVPQPLHKTDPPSFWGAVHMGAPANASGARGGGARRRGSYAASGHMQGPQAPVPPGVWGASLPMGGYQGAGSISISL